MLNVDFPKVCQTLQTFIELNLATAEGNRNGPLESGFIRKGTCSADICKYQCFTVLATKKKINVRIHHPWPIVSKRTEKSIN